MSDLKPPTPTVEKQDPGAHDLVDSSEEDNFTDASEGAAASRKSNPSVPTTRVERVDSAPAHGEQPGTEAYAQRTQDALPDELEVIPESEALNVNATKLNTTTDTKVEASIPKMVVEKVDPATPSHGEVPHTPAWELRRADAQPDVVRQAPPIARSGELSENDEIEAGAADDADDFDEFEVGDDDDDDFGGFDEGENETLEFEEEGTTPLVEEPSSFHLSPLDYSMQDTAESIAQASTAHLSSLFPHVTFDEPDPKLLSDINPGFLTERSQSLWAQLVAPPPLQPPDWVRSRIRRLFLVSLGVPVDLDEILPASKQKKLVLPSIDVESERGSADNLNISKLKQKNESSTSVASSTAKSERRRKGPAPPPEFDENVARLLCSTTSVALNGLSDAELVAHVKRMEEFKSRAVQTLEYWLIQKDSAAGDKEAFEAVIENLVNHAKKIRK